MEIAVCIAVILTALATLGLFGFATARFFYELGKDVGRGEHHTG
jgi:hypothetical protein